jgi:large subunit ribosomal protein L4
VDYQIIINNKNSTLDLPKWVEDSKPSDNHSLIHITVKGYLKNLRAGLACTKSKGLVSGGGAKPFKQKGTGRARQGSSRSPLMPGGGVAHGPKRRTISAKINRKVAAKALAQVMSDRFLNSAVLVYKAYPSHNKTKAFLKDLNLPIDFYSANTLIIYASSHNEPIKLALRNVRNFNLTSAATVNALDCIKAKYVVISEGAMNEMTERLEVSC